MSNINSQRADALATLIDDATRFDFEIISPANAGLAYNPAAFMS